MRGERGTAAGALNPRAWLRRGHERDEADRNILSENRARMGIAIVCALFNCPLGRDRRRLCKEKARMDAKRATEAAEPSPGTRAKAKSRRMARHLPSGGKLRRSE
jgi:hypothetical protein